MFKKITLGAALIAATSMIMSPARAEQNVLTDAQVASIRTHCTEIQGSLNRLRQTDTLLRYNRGQLYRSIADKLMTPFNQRVASNRLDGSELLKTSAEYNAGYKTFFDAYRDYDVALGEAQQIDCTKQQVAFYDKLMIAREKRIKLHETSVKLVALATQYREQINTFKTSVDKAGQ